MIKIIPSLGITQYYVNSILFTKMNTFYSNMIHKLKPHTQKRNELQLTMQLLLLPNISIYII